MEDEATTKKFVLMGLDNAGKSSILLNFKKDSNLLSYLSLKPTRKINIKKFNTDKGNASIWDFGGQKTFREEYLQNLPEYLAEVGKILFVIDVQAIDRYEESLGYLEKIIKKLEKNQIKKDFTIFLHKFDPNIRKIEGFEDIDSIVNKRLIAPIEELMPDKIKYDIFKTCIATSFRKSSI
jgi:small GTP-binding protein